MTKDAVFGDEGTVHRGAAFQHHELRYGTLFQTAAASDTWLPLFQEGDP